MLRRSPQAALLWCAAIVVAAVTAISVAGTLASLRRQDARYGRVRESLVAARDLPAGSTVAADDVRAVHTRGDGPAPGTLHSKRTVEGRTVAVALLRGDAVTARHLASRRRDGRDGVVPPGWRAMRVVLEDATRVRVGDHVDVYVTFDPSKAGPEAEPTLTVARGVPVVGVDRDVSTNGSGSGNRLGVTVLVGAEEAGRLAYATANGALALALVPPEEALGPAADRLR